LTRTRPHLLPNVTFAMQAAPYVIRHKFNK